MESLSSKLLDNAVNQLNKLPGIGKKSALRLALFLLKQTPEEVELFTQSIQKMKSEICYCSNCHNLSDNNICEICANPKRDKTQLCVVQDIRDVIALENTGQYHGIYHVLGGLISPMDGIGPGDLNIQSLCNKCEEGHIREIIFAMPATPEGDTTNYYIYKHIKDKVSAITTIARGIGIGEELEYTDELTLGRSLLARMDFESIFKEKKNY